MSLTVLTSVYGFAETLDRLRDAIARRQLKLFGEFDHAAAAREVGLELKDEIVVVFGNPQAGTPLMQDDATVGIDLPIRMLLWDRGDAIALAYRDPRGLAKSHAVHAHAATLDAMASLLADLAHDATQ